MPAVEITDLLWHWDADGCRRPVSRSHVLDLLTDNGQHGAARIVARMPATADVLDPDAIDALGVRVHCEIQRLGEELQFGRRTAALLAPWFARLEGRQPARLVDVGCGLGFTLRSIALRGDLPGVELVGVDLNRTLIEQATELAEAEGLPVRFVVGDAMQPGVGVDDPAGTVMMSSGLLHHLPERDLTDFFAAQAKLDIAGFAHWDIAPCLWSTVGAWVFHYARMREPVSRHDGVLSARRAHPAEVLLRAANSGAADYSPRVLEGPRWHPRAIDVLRPIVGELT